MSARWLALLVVPALAFGGTACAAGPSDPTLGSQCREMLHTVCARAIDECKLTGWEASVDQCVTNGVTTCCAGACDQTAKSTEDEIQTCQRAVAAASCGTFATGGLPSECVHVVR